MDSEGWYFCSETRLKQLKRLSKYLAPCWQFNQWCWQPARRDWGSKGKRSYGRRREVRFQFINLVSGTRRKWVWPHTLQTPLTNPSRRVFVSWYSCSAQEWGNASHRAQMSLCYVIKELYYTSLVPIPLPVQFSICQKWTLQPFLL